MKHRRWLPLLLFWAGIGILGFCLMQPLSIYGSFDVRAAAAGGAMSLVGMVWIVVVEIARYRRATTPPIAECRSCQWRGRGMQGMICPKCHGEIRWVKAPAWMLCMQCQYLLADLQGDRCPECGSALTEQQRLAGLGGDGDAGSPREGG